MKIDDAVEFIRREYAELPGLKLTVSTRYSAGA